MSLWQDLRHGVRIFARNPGFTAIAVISIALGTGANVAIFSLADALLLRPLPVEKPHELVTVGSRVTLGMVTTSLASYPDYVDIRDRAQSFSGLAAFEFAPAALRTRPGAPARMRLATVVSGNLFQTMGVEPFIGRGFRPEEERVSGQNTVAVLSYGMWKAEFDADPSVVGRHITVAGIDCVIVGVTPESFTGLHMLVRDSVFLPLAMWPRLANFSGIDPLTARDFRQLTLKGRLKPGVSLADAQAELTVIGGNLEAAYPATNKNQLPVAETEFEVNWERRPLDVGLIAILTTLSVAVLGVACANVGGMLASWAPVRRREMALRLAIGAGRGRLIRQLLSESLAIAAAGSVGGVAVGYLGIRLLRQIQLPTDMISPLSIELNQRDLMFSLAVAAASAVLVGLGPALQTTRVDLASTIKLVGAEASTRLRLTSRHVLVGAQVALCLALVTISAHAYHVFGEQARRGPGFRTTQAAKITLNPGQAGLSERESVQFFEQVLEDTRGLPGVRSATVLSAMPLFSFAVVPIAPEGYELPDGQSGIFTIANDVDEHYFDTMEISIIAGRGFAKSDDADAARVAIVNERFAQRYWPGQSAIGRRFQIVGRADTRWIEIVGIATTTMYLYPAEAPQPAIYLPFRQRPDRMMVLLASGNTDSASLLAGMSGLIKQTAPDIPTHDVQTVEAFYDARFGSLGRVLTNLIAGMGLMGVALTMVGLYGLVAYAVSRRTREIGIRMAIGATPANVIGMILRQGLHPVWWGLGFGVLLSIVAIDRLPNLVHVITSLDRRVFPAALVLMFAVVLLAAFLPARRAAKVNPTTALRCE